MVVNCLSLIWFPIRRCRSPISRSVSWFVVVLCDSPRPSPSFAAGDSETDISKKNMSTENKLGMSGKRVCGNLGEVTRSLSRLGITLQKQSFFFLPMNAIYMTNITHAAICYCMFNLSPAFWMLSQLHQHLLMFASTSPPREVIDKVLFPPSRIQ